MNPVRWSRRSDGSIVAEATVAGVRCAGVASAEDVARESAVVDEIGWSLSLKKLGKSLKKVASPKALLSLAANVQTVINKVPGAKLALGALPGGSAMMGGLAAARMLARAKQGDRSAQAVVQKADRIASMSPDAQSRLVPPSTPEGDQVRWLVMLQKLDG